MSENKKYNYRFLFKKSILPQIYLEMFLGIDEFVSKINERIKNNQDIDDESIYEIIKPIYFTKYKAGEKSSDARMMYKSIRKLSKKIYGNEDAWKSDFENYN